MASNKLDLYFFDIVEKLVSCTDAVVAYSKEMKEVKDNYKGTTLEMELRRIAEAFGRKTRSAIDAALADAKAMRSVMEEENAYTFDLPIHETAELLKVPGIPITALRKTVEPFRRNNTALALMWAAAEKARNAEASGYIHSFMYDWEKVMDDLETKIYHLQRLEPGGYADNISDIKTMLYEIASKEGIELGKKWDELTEKNVANIMQTLSTSYN